MDGSDRLALAVTIALTIQAVFLIIYRKISSK
jgi:hypothetical protein